MSAAQVPGCTLADLVAEGLALELKGDPKTRVIGVRHDSREVLAGELFVAVAGAQSDGTQFIEGARSHGAVAVVVEAFVDTALPQLLVADTRDALASLSERIYGAPTSSLKVVGLTGTNGKTTTAWVVGGALAHLGAETALLGTVEGRIGGHSQPAPFTTPEADAISRFARRALVEGADHLVMEVSSHGLSLHRADAVCFDVVTFSNLTRDHLDFHPDMESYFLAKARLFTELSAGAAVISIDDSYGLRLAELTALPTLRVSTRLDADADLWPRKVAYGRDGIDAEIETPKGLLHLKSSLLGPHNLQNLCVAAGVLLSLGYSVSDISAALRVAPSAPGRLEPVDGLPGVRVLVDYAHTPDALERALAALRPLTPGRLVVVFGCGGDRDPGKRPTMGRRAAEGADLAVVTSDNPRTEDPESILTAIEPGLVAGGMKALGVGENFGQDAATYCRIEDRRAAIVAAIDVALPGDTVLIAGKGHEDYQLRREGKIHFDDRQQAAAAISVRLSAEPGAGVGGS